MASTGNRPRARIGLFLWIRVASPCLCEIQNSGAHLVVLGFFLFYLTLDALFAVVFLVFALGLTLLASWIAALPVATSGTIAAVLFFGGYVAQFIGHAIEKSMPVLVKHPVQANLAAPFFTVVEMFKLLGLRDELFNEVQRQISLRRQSAAESG